MSDGYFGFDPKKFTLVSPIFTGAPTSPTPPQFNNTERLATTEFVQRALGSFSGQSNYNASTQLTAADAGKLIVISAAAATPTLTLPDAASVPIGTALWFCGNAQSFPPIIAAKAGDSLVRPDASVGSVQMSANGTLVVRKALSGVWFVADGTDAFKYMNSLFGSSLAASGYQKLPSGLIIQWGKYTGTVSANGNSPAISLPITFPNGHLCGVVSENSSDITGTAAGWAYLATASTITLYNVMPESRANATYILIGY